VLLPLLDVTKCNIAFFRVSAVFATYPSRAAPLKLLRNCWKFRCSILGFDIYFYYENIETKPASAKSVVTRFPIEKTGTYLVTVLKPDGLGMKIVNIADFPQNRAESAT
jgi:hypothetical protein